MFCQNIQLHRIFKQAAAIPLVISLNSFNLNWNEHLSAVCSNTSRGGTGDTSFVKEITIIFVEERGGETVKNAVLFQTIPACHRNWFTHVFISLLYLKSHKNMFSRKATILGNGSFWVKTD